MKEHEEQKIVQWNKGISGEVKITLKLTDDKRSDDLRLFCNELSGSAAKVRISEDNGGDAEYPCIAIRENLHYYAVPSHAELDPFLQAVAYLDDGFALLPKTILDRVAEIDIPSRLAVYVSPHCPHCPGSVSQLLPLVFANELISLEIIDGAFLPELAQSKNIECLPTTLTGNGNRWSGVTPLEDIVEVIANRDSSTLSAAALERMLDERNALKAAHEMIKSGKVHPSLMEFMVDDRFFLRLGAMTAIEEIISQNPEMAAQIIEPLWEKFIHAIEPMQIDILYLLGDAGTLSTVPLLESVVSGNHRDHVKDAASEAIECINSRYS